MAKDFDIVSGEFEGNFFTHQKSVLTPSEWNSTEKDHAIHLYRGELKNIAKESNYKPEEFRNRESLLLHNVTNVQFHTTDGSGENTSRIYDFEQLLIRDALIKESWELNGKTYGVVSGKILGKVRQRNSNFDATNPPPPSLDDIPVVTPDDGRVHYPPPEEELKSVVRRGGSCLSGCLSNIWRLLIAIILFILLMWMLKGCFVDYRILETCCTERDSLKLENKDLIRILDSLQTSLEEIRDSLELDKIQEEIDNLSSRVYFKGNTDQILKYSKTQINKIVNLIINSGNLEVEVRGFYNGIYGGASELDLKRAEKVKELLIEKGVDRNLISAIGKGQSFIDDENYLEDIIINGEAVKWNRNMRVEIKIVKY
jgi:outer membrane protein OmpA-like peptidoglycan-associated protein